MPWEIDYAMLSFIQLKKSAFYFPEDYTIKIDTCLNLSSHLINWKETKFPKQYFIDKFNDLHLLLDRYVTKPYVYEGNELFGFFDVQKKTYEPEVDYNIGLCPDIYLSETLIYSMVEAAKQVPNKHFVITPEIYKCWDSTWDPLTNELYKDIPHAQHRQGDIFKVRHNMKTLKEEIYLDPISKPKWAWWSDLYSKEFYETIAPVPDEWTGYGGWDHYSNLIATCMQQIGQDFQQYSLRGQTAFEYNMGDLFDEKYTSVIMRYYKKYFSINSNIPNQRTIFDKEILIPSVTKRLKDLWGVEMEYKGVRPK